MRYMFAVRCCCAAALTFCACLATAGRRQPPAFSWKLPNSLFQELTVFERKQYKKAEDLFAAKKYKQAALEFDKFTLENENSPALVAAVFMKAYCLEHDLKRYEAIKMYYEVVDIFPDDMTYAPVAMYQVGCCHLNNGDRKSGLKAMYAFVTNEKYNRHPLAANALRLLADNAKKNREMAKAYRFLEQIYRDFYDSNRAMATAARDELVRHYIKDRKYAKAEMLLAKHDWKKPRDAWQYWNYLYDNAVYAFTRGYSAAAKKERAYRKDTEAFFDYWRGGREIYVKAARETDYLYRSFNFSVGIIADKDVWDPICEEYLRKSGGNEGTVKHVMLTLIDRGFTTKALDLAGRLKSDGALKSVIATLMKKGLFDQAMPLTGKIKDRAAFYPWFFDQLLAHKEYDYAAHVLEKIEDPGLHHWDDYLLNDALKRWKSCVKILKNIAATDQDRATKANWALAKIYQGMTRQYDDAIKIYTVINDPPASVWPIAQCYQAKGEMKRAAQTLTEVENFFPKFAAEAAWRRGELYRHFGATEKAVAEYRRILKVYKKTPQSSQAHQRLEDYGIKTGGGVVE